MTTNEPPPQHLGIVVLVVLALLYAVLATSCTDVSVVTTAGGNRVAHIGSFATRSKARVLKVTLPDGTVLEASGDNDETVLPRMSLMAGLAGQMVEKAPAIVKAIKP